MAFFNFLRKAKAPSQSWNLDRLIGCPVDVYPQGGRPLTGFVSHTEGKTARVALDDERFVPKGTEMECFVKVVGLAEGEFLTFRAVAGDSRTVAGQHAMDAKLLSPPLPGQKRSFFRVPLDGSMMAFASAWAVPDDMIMPDTAKGMECVRNGKALNNPFVDDISGAGIALRFAGKDEKLDAGTRVVCLVSCVGAGPDVQFWADCRVTGAREKEGGVVCGMRFDRWANAGGETLSWFNCTLDSGVTPVNRWALDAEKARGRLAS